MKSIKGKLFLMSFISIILTSAVAIVCMYVGDESVFNQTTSQTVDSSMNILQSQIEDMKQFSASMAKVIATDDAVQQAVKSADKQQVLSVVNKLFDDYKFGVEYAIICDANGSVIARTNSDQSGDSIANESNIKSALNGTPGTNIETGALIQMTVHSSHPVTDSTGSLIGVISAGYRLDTNDFVDSLQKITNTDFTVFKDNIRIATTISKGGVRQTGTVLNEAVADIVLKQNKSYNARADILDNPYYTSYMPIVNDGKVIGAFLAAQPLSQMAAEKAKIMLTAGAAVALMCGLIIIVVLRVTNKQIVIPVLNISDVAMELSKGNLNINDKPYQSKDELGHLSSSMHSISVVMKNLLMDLDHMSAQHHIGETDTFIDTARYTGSYSEVAAAVNRMVQEHADTNGKVIKCMMSMVEGDFSAYLEKLPGKKAYINGAIDGLRNGLQGISNEVDFMIKNAMAGHLAARIDTTKYKGDWIGLLNGLNDLMAAIMAPISEASDVLKQVSGGNFDQKVSGDYKGDFLLIKDSINSTITNIASYINEISNVLSAISNNDDLSQEITREYAGKFSEIKNAMNEIVRKFNDIIAEIYNASDYVASGAKRISDSSMSLAQGASEQAAAVDRMSATIITVNESATKNAYDAKDAENLAISSKNSALEGDRDMKNMLISMEGINNSSKNISNIIKVIDDIAFQTNLLALNAAVEAARAGEHGKGFSVVAEEVRNLAGKSLNAAKQITELIDESINRVNEGSKTATTTADALNTIVDSVSKVSGIITNITEASSRQEETLAQVKDNLVQITGVVQSNSATSEEAASASQELASQADVLKSLVSVFKLKNKN